MLSFSARIHTIVWRKFTHNLCLQQYVMNAKYEKKNDMNFPTFFDSQMNNNQRKKLNLMVVHAWRNLVLWCCFFGSIHFTSSTNFTNLILPFYSCCFATAVWECRICWTLCATQKWVEIKWEQIWRERNEIKWTQISHHILCIFVFFHSLCAFRVRVWCMSVWLALAFRMNSISCLASCG